MRQNIMNRLKSRAKQALYNDQGVALIIALATFALVSVLGIAAMVVANGGVNMTVYDRANNQAFQAAEGGLDQALDRARRDTLSGDFFARFSSGEASVSVTNINEFLYRVKSVGAHPTLAAPKSMRAVEAIIVDINPDDFLFADGMQARLLGNTNIDGPLYLRDEIDVSGEGDITGGPLFIKDDPLTVSPTGDLLITGSGRVGTPAEPIYAFIDGTYPASELGDQLNVVEIYTDVPDLEMPVITGADMPAWRAKADIIIDENSNPDEWDSFTNTLVIDRDTDDFTSSTAGGHFTWDKPPGNGTRWRGLDVEGLIFIDGGLSLGDFSLINDIRQTGVGTLVVNGVIGINSQLRPHPYPSTPYEDSWPGDPGVNVLGIITPYEVDLQAKAPNDDVFAVIYANEKINFKTGVSFYGTAMTHLMYVDAGQPSITIISPFPSGAKPPGMPSIDPQTFISGWSEVKP